MKLLFPWSCIEHDYGCLNFCVPPAALSFRTMSPWTIQERATHHFGDHKKNANWDVKFLTWLSFRVCERLTKNIVHLFRICAPPPPSWATNHRHNGSNPTWARVLFMAISIWYVNSLIIPKVAMQKGATVQGCLLQCAKNGKLLVITMINHRFPSTAMNKVDH